MMKQPQDKQYDYIFCGGGASACLLLLRMQNEGLLQHKTVLIIDKEKKNRKDKTFCFWSERDEPIEHELQSIISQSWTRVKLPNLSPSSLDPLRYNHVSSLDLYSLIDSLAERNGWDHYTGEVLEITAQPEGHCVVLKEECFRCTTVFDSRTPVFKSPNKTETHLHQSFVGWHIQLKNAHSNSEAFRFMDFDVDQQDHTQFVYVLPYSDGSILVEVTRFGLDVLSAEEATVLLQKYIARNFGDYVIIAKEHGCIPMSNCAIEPSDCTGVVQLGARNYSIKCSTGYAFKRMFDHAGRITDHMNSGRSAYELNQNHRASNRGRFAFYDRLLLDILAHKPHYGKPIFEHLFKRNSIQRIMTFLDERTSLREEVAIFATLPLVPFLGALLRTLLRSSLFRPILLTFLCLLFSLMPIEAPTAQLIAACLLLIGLVTVGIPHGAVDHLLDTRQWSRRHAPGFIAKYLSIAALMGVVWFIAPTPALLCFIIYSAWHFGQADGELWSMKPMSSLLWGASVLTYIIGTHRIETNAVLSVMGTVSLPVDISPWSIIPWMVFFAYRSNMAGVITICWLMLTAQLPLLLAFGIYFIGQHSLTGWQHIQQHLRMSHKAIWMHALPFHAGAWILLMAFYALANSSDHSHYFFSWGHFFIFLACISLPHAWAMRVVYKK